MKTNFQVIGINSNKFQHLFQLEEEQLNKLGARRSIVESKPNYPCRVSLEDAEIGEEVILLPYTHLSSNSPYESRGPVFIRKNAKDSQLGVNEIPLMLIHRLLSLRGYDEEGMMIEAIVVEGSEVDKTIQQFFANTFVHFIHVHNAGPGCFNCEIKRK